MREFSPLSGEEIGARLDLNAGPVAWGKYRLLRKVGQGSRGVVYWAEDTTNQQTVAIKLLGGDWTQPDDRLRQFLYEARTAAQVTHPHMVTVHQADLLFGVPYLVMEWLPGGSLQDRLNQQQPLSWREASRWIADVCEGLAAMHSVGLLHRAIKPANILLNEEEHAQLGDFDLLCRPQRGGTPSPSERWYQSPEYALGKPIDERSDLYAVGMTYLALLLSGCATTIDEALRELQAEPGANEGRLPAALAELPTACLSLLRKTLAIRPEDRYSSAQELLWDLRRLLLTHSESAMLVADPALADASGNGSQDTIVPLTEPVPQRFWCKKWVWLGMMLLLLLIALEWFDWLF